jgi:hypothetical protein
MGFENGDLVTENKAVHYMDQVIIKQGNPRKRMPDGSNAPYSFETVSMFVKSIRDLFEHQVEQQTNQRSNCPRGEVMKKLLTGYRLGEASRKRAMYVDRHQNTLNDGYQKDQLQEIADYFLKNDTLHDLRNRADFLLLYGMLGRSQSTRMAQLPDFFSLEVPDEGPTQCDVLVMIMNVGKTNQYGKLEYGAVMRNKDVRKCALGGLALYLFSRFHVEGEEFPVFLTRRHW